MKKPAIPAIVLASLVLFPSSADTLRPARDPLTADSSDVFPLDLAFTGKALTLGDRPVLSPDGAFLVYSVTTPKLKKPGTDEEYRFLPNGTPADFDGARLFIQDVASGRTRPLLPGEANSWRPVLSPDATRVAFYSDAGGFPQLWIYDVTSGQSRRAGVQKIKPKLWPGDEPCWTPDGAEIFVPLSPAGESQPALAPAKPAPAEATAAPRVSVYTAGKDAAEPSPAEGFPTDAISAFLNKENNVTLAAVHVASGRIRVIAPFDSNPRPAAMRLSPSGKYVAYEGVFFLKEATSSETFFDLAVIPASGGKPVFVAKGLPVREGEYLGSSYAWRPGHDQLVYLKDQKVWFVDLTADSGPEPRQLAERDSAFALYPLDFAPDGNWLIVGRNPIDDHDYRVPRPTELLCLSMTDHPARALPLDPRWRFQGLIHSAPRTFWIPPAGTCAASVEDVESGERAFVNLDFASGQSANLWKGSSRVGIYGVTGDGAAVLASYEDSRTPRDLYLFSGGFSSKTKLTSVEPRYEAVRPGPVKSFETVIPSYDGRLVKARTTILLPSSYQTGDACPTVVMHYGGLRLSSSADEFGGGGSIAIPALLFTSRGYAVLLPDLIIGPQGQGGNPARDLTDMLLPQVYKAVDLGYCDIERMAITGQSYGGYGTAAIITETNLFRAAAALDGVYDLVSCYAWMAKDGTMFTRNWAEAQGRMGTHPWASLKRYIDNSPFFHAERINTPLLLLHGAADAACPVEQARMMYSALERLGKTVQFAEYAAEGHVVGEWSFDNALDAYRRILDFLEKHLAPPSK